MEMRVMYKSGIIGLVVGDALGVPSEYATHEELMADPINGMREPGVYGLPKGCWSDDSALTIATLESIYDSGLEYSLHDVMDSMMRYMENPSLNPMGKYMSPGTTTIESVERYRKSKDTESCGGRNTNDNGNGSLMRILPVCIYLWQRMHVEKRKWLKAESGSFQDLKAEGGILKVLIDLVEEASALTHAHVISRTACGIYYFLVESVLDNAFDGTDLPMNDILTRAFEKATLYYMVNGDPDRGKALEEFSFLGEDPKTFYSMEWNMKKVYDCGAYVVDTLEAVIACLSTTASYKECMLKCANLGGDTDTVAAIAGGIAGLYYGYESIPSEWLEDLQMRKKVETLCEKMDSRKNLNLEDIDLPEELFKSIRRQFRWENEFTFHDCEYIRTGSREWAENLYCCRKDIGYLKQLSEIMRNYGYHEWADSIIDNRKESMLEH